MNILLLILGGLAILLITIALFASYLRMRSPHSKKMALEQEQLDKKTRTKAGEAGTTSTSGSPSKVDPLGMFKFKSVLLISLIIGLATLLWWFFPSRWESPSLAKVVEWKNVYWLPILIVLGVVYFLAARSEEKVAKETATAVLAISVFMLFIGFPVWVWVTGPSTAVTASEARVLSMPPGGKSARIPVPYQKQVVMSGEDFRYHCVYQDGHEESFGEGERSCASGNLPFVYATNLRAKEGNVVTYSYK
ncbi:MAG: hypothetical protein WC790_00810 [Candidatus Paceibacterota bacterium]|jgi:hypothetical protein